MLNAFLVGDLVGCAELFQLMGSVSVFLVLAALAGQSHNDGVVEGYRTVDSQTGQHLRRKRTYRQTVVLLPGKSGPPFST
jgi:hypothetical protein